MIRPLGRHLKRVPSPLKHKHNVTFRWQSLLKVNHDFPSSLHRALMRSKGGIIWSKDGRAATRSNCIDVFHCSHRCSFDIHHKHRVYQLGSNGGFNSVPGARRTGTRQCGSFMCSRWIVRNSRLQRGRRFLTSRRSLRSSRLGGRNRNSVIFTQFSAFLDEQIKVRVQLRNSFTHSAMGASITMPRSFPPNQLHTMLFYRDNTRPLPSSLHLSCPVEYALS